MSFFSYLKQCFAPPLIRVAPTEVEQIALRNLVAISKERLWLADSYPKQPAPSMEFQSNMDGEQIDTCQQSIAIVEQYINNFKHLEQSDEIRP